MDEALYEEMAAQERTYWWFVAKRRILRTLILRFLASPTPRRPLQALDIGCGTGALLEELTALGFKAVGCDTHPASLAACRALGLEVGEGTLPDNLPYRDPEFDAIVLSDVLEHVDADAASVAAVTSLLAPSGILVCTVPAHPWMWTRRDDLHHHKRRYRRSQFRRLFPQDTLREELFSYYNSALFPIMVGSRIMNRWIDSPDGPDIRSLPSILNSTLRMVFESERSLLGRVPLPPGGSIISIHRRLE